MPRRKRPGGCEGHRQGMISEDRTDRPSSPRGQAFRRLPRRGRQSLLERLQDGVVQDQDLWLMDRPKLLSDFYKDARENAPRPPLQLWLSKTKSTRVNTTSGVLEFQLFPAPPTSGHPSCPAFADSRTRGLPQLVVRRGNAILSSSSHLTRGFLEPAGVIERPPGRSYIFSLAGSLAGQISSGPWQ